MIETTMPTVEGWYWVSHWEADEPQGAGQFDQWQIMYFVPGEQPQLLGFPPEIHVLGTPISVSRWRLMPDGYWDDSDPIQGQPSGSWCGPKRWQGPLLSPLEKARVPA